MRAAMRIVGCVVGAGLLASTSAAQVRPSPRAKRPPVAPGTVPSARPRPTRAEIQAVGRAMWDYDRDRFGVVRISGWEPRLDTLMHRLGVATALPGMELQYVVLDTPDINAAAYPGGFVSINRGLLEFADDVASRAPDTSGRAARATAYMAAVVSHELAHVTLGHVNELVDEILKRARPAGARGALPNAPRLRSIVAEVDKKELAARRHIRDQESAADVTGALYMVRAGWEIQSAIDLMHALDSLDRGDPRRRPRLAELTWLQDHPRAAAREVALEAFRARLKAHQVELDDALTLIANDVEPALAISLLDKVLADFPDLPAARQARAAALQQQYLATVPVQVLRMRTSTLTFGSRYLIGIRGTSDGADALLARSRAAYETLLQGEAEPYALSNLAVLDAYAGEFARARERSNRAYDIAPGDADILNNRGVVEYLAGDHAAARKTFEALLRAWGDSAPPRVLFNYGRILIDLHDPEGVRVMQEYLATGDQSGWTTLARALLRRADTTAARVVAPARADPTSAPIAAGVALGSSAAQLRAILGAPASGSGVEADSVWDFPERGVSVAIDSAGVRLIVLHSAKAGAVHQVSVGDALGAVRSAWGAPTDDDGETMVFEHDGWFEAVHRGEGLVREIAVGRLP